MDRSPNVGLDILTPHIFDRHTDRTFSINDAWKLADQDAIKFTGGTISNKGIYSYKFLAAPINGTQYYADNFPITLDWNREYRSFHPIRQFISANQFSATTYDLYVDINEKTYQDNLVPL
jgi:hypothetical protein